MAMRGLILVLILMIISILNLGCTSVRHKPCTVGGQPARETAAVPLLGGIKRCHQIVNKEGYTVNHGKYFEWYQNDTIAITGEYEQGKKTGRWIEYDPKGNKTSDKYFAAGKEVAPP